MASSLIAQGPLSQTDVFAYAMSFVNLSDVLNCARVSKLWNQCSQNPALWQGLFISQGIPMVSQEGGMRDYREDFRVLYPVTTVSGQVFRKIFGEPVGDVPCIPAEIFDRLSQPDPFEPEKLQKDTFELVVEYPFVRRALTPSTPLALDALGYLIYAPRIGGETSWLIPFSLKNRITLCLFTLTGKEIPQVFGFIDPKVMQQCDYCPAKVNVYYQRKESVMALRGLPYSEQKTAVEEKNLEVMPLGSIALSGAVNLLQTGNHRLYVNTSSSVCDETLQLDQSSIGSTEGVKGIFIKCNFRNSQMSVIAGRLI